VPAKDYQPVPVAISLAGPAFGGIHQALLAESNQPVALARTNGRTDLTVVPGPVATVVLKSRPP
jgi:hypothetical protein